MSEPEITSSPNPEQDSTTTQTPTQPEIQPDQPTEPTKPEKPIATTFSIWPPTQRTRDAVINRLIETLSTDSVLSKRYGTIPHEEASAAARRIEEEAYAAAGSAATSEDDGIEVLQVYSKEISKRMLDAVKARSASGSTEENGVSQTPATPPVASSTPSEEISYVEN